MGGLATGLASAGIMVLLVTFLQNSPWVSWEFLEGYRRGVYYLPFLLGTSYLLQFFLRGYLSLHWGRGSVAFLESVTIAVGMQHVLPFVLLLPMIFIWQHESSRHGVVSAALARALWTAIVILAAVLISPSSIHVP